MDPGMSMAKVSHVEDTLVFCCPNDLQRSMPGGNESSNYILSGIPFFSECGVVVWNSYFFSGWWSGTFFILEYWEFHHPN
jgi:hypothetical protein